MFFRQPESAGVRYVSAQAEPKEPPRSGASVAGVSRRRQEATTKSRLGTRLSAKSCRRNVCAGPPRSSYTASRSRDPVPFGFAEWR